MMKAIALLSAGLVALLSAGCSSPSPSELNYSVRTIPSVSRQAALEAARQAVQEHFRVDVLDSTAGVVTSLPTESWEKGRSGRVGDVLGTPRRMRRIAEVRVREAGNGVRVWCKVRVQEYETDERRLFMREHDDDDYPTETPAQRDAATLAEQNATWRDRPRDKVLERQILQAIVEHTTPRSAAAPAAG
jgi:hypothetical protein